MPFACLAFKHIPALIRDKKLDAHAVPYVYLGVDPKSLAYLLGLLYELHIQVAVDVTFFENVFPFRKFKARDSPASLLWNTETSLQEGDPRLGMFADDYDETAKLLDRNGALPSQIRAPADKKQAQPSPQAQVDATAQQDAPSLFRPMPGFNVPVRIIPPPRPAPPQRTFVVPPQSVFAEPTRRSRRTPVPSRRGLESIAAADVAPTVSRQPESIFFTQAASSTDSQDFATILATMTEASLQSITPCTAREALSSPQKYLWLQAMVREQVCHYKNGTFSEQMEQKDESDAKVVPTNWVLKIKYRGPPIDLSLLMPLMFKARVVVRVQYMREGLHYNDRFAPVAKPSTVRTVFAFATANHCQLRCGDVETAFLTAKMDCAV